MSEPEREALDIDVLFVGGGPASLAGATRLAQLVAEHRGRKDEPPLEISIAVLEKGREVGSHSLSGAVLDLRALRELYPEDWQEAPLEGPVRDEQLLWLTRRRAVALPIPSMLRNDGKQVVSLGRLVKWLAARAEDVGVDIFCEFPATEVLIEDERIIGVRTGDRGVDREGRRKVNYEPGIDIHSRIVVLGEGPQGTLTRHVEDRFGLREGRNPQTFALGLKEVWELPSNRLPAGKVIHTMGWPLDRHTFGGGFLYMMQDDLFVVGLAIGMDYRDPLLDPHEEFQRFKTHPHIASLLRQGTMRYYGAKVIPEGGRWAMPALAGAGFLIIGDGAGFLNSQRLKGIHLAMKSGMLAAETAFEALRSGSTSAADLSDLERRVRQSWAGAELHAVRNFHQAFDHGRMAGMLQAGLGRLTGGRGFGIFDRLRTEPGHSRMQRLGDSPPASPEPPAYDGKLTFDKMADVYNAAIAHEEDQPIHLRVADTDVCVSRCAVEYANPCQRFCPANVYEIEEDSSSSQGSRLQINASNCLHCKTCEIMDPYQIITWVPPEGGAGPNYGRM